jgi:hypothetical protein
MNTSSDQVHEGNKLESVPSFDYELGCLGAVAYQNRAYRAPDIGVA